MTSMTGWADYLKAKVRLRQAVDGFSACWEWSGAANSKGYGVAKHGGVRDYAHRASHRVFKGEPGDLQVDHLCYNKLCINPDHLEAVPAVVNVRRANLWHNGRPYALFFDRRAGLWVAGVEIGGSGRRRKKLFRSRDRSGAVTKVEAYLDA